MSDRNRQLLLLAALIVGFLFVVGRQLLSGPGGGGSAPRRAAASGDAASVDGAVEVAELRLGALEHKPATYSPGRDPFRFAPRRRKAPREPKAKPAAQRPEPPPPQLEPQTPPEPPRPRPPAIEFVYLGSFGVPGREIAVFSDGKQILNAFAGDVVQQEFVVRSIGYESADIGFVNFPDEPAKRLAVGG